MSEARYAIYLAPPPDTPLWAFGSRVLGYDAVTGEDQHGFAPAGLDSAQWRGLTERPRSYGFHATLKAPFRLAADRSGQELEAELAAFCRTRTAFDPGPLAVTTIVEADQGFAALTLMRPSPELAELEWSVVRHFDSFRAPLTAEEIGKRRPEKLSARQREALSLFGYPYVGPDYRFHMTLSGGIADVATVADRLADTMANEIGTAHLPVDALVLFRQESARDRFRVVRRFELYGGSS